MSLTPQTERCFSDAVQVKNYEIAMLRMDVVQLRKENEDLRKALTDKARSEARLRRRRVSFDQHPATAVISEIIDNAKLFWEINKDKSHAVWWHLYIAMAPLVLLWLILFALGNVGLLMATESRRFNYPPPV